MDDVELYGPVLHETGLMEAVERRVLAGFEIDVLEIRDPSPLSENATDEERRGRRLADLRAALLKHADEIGTRSYMTFHSRTLDALAFARAMPETAARLHASDPAARPPRRPLPVRGRTRRGGVGVRAVVPGVLPGPR